MKLKEIVCCMALIVGVFQAGCATKKDLKQSEEQHERDIQNLQTSLENQEATILEMREQLSQATQSLRRIESQLDQMKEVLNLDIGSEETVAIDFEQVDRNNVSFDSVAGGYRFDGVSSYLQLGEDLPRKIGRRNFSISFEFEAEQQKTPTGYIMEHHKAFPWTGLFVAIENNKTLRFRVKDLPHNDIQYDIANCIGDGCYHRVLLNRREKFLEMYLDGVLVVSEEQPELVDLNIEYGGKRVTVGSHCEKVDAAFYMGLLRNMKIHIGRCLKPEEVSVSKPNTSLQ